MQPRHRLFEGQGTSADGSRAIMGEVRGWKGEVGRIVPYIYARSFGRAPTQGLLHRQCDVYRLGGGGGFACLVSWIF